MPPDPSPQWRSEQRIPSSESCVGRASCVMHDPCLMPCMVSCIRQGRCRYEIGHDGGAARVLPHSDATCHETKRERRRACVKTSPTGWCRAVCVTQRSHSVPSRRRNNNKNNPRACATMSPTSPRRIAARFPPPPPPPLLLSRRPPTALPPPPRNVPVLPLDQRCGRDEASHQNRRLSERRECNCRCCRSTSAAARRGRARVCSTPSDIRDVEKK